MYPSQAQPSTVANRYGERWPPRGPRGPSPPAPIHLAPRQRPSLRARGRSGWRRGGGTPRACRRHRQVDAGKDREAPSLIGAVASCGSFGARDLSPDRERLRPDGSVLAGGEVIAVEMEEVVDLVVGGEEPLRLAG